MTETVRDLDRLLREMRAELAPGSYGYVTLEAIPAGLDPLLIFREAEGMTLVLPWDQAAPFDPMFPCRLITLTVNSALDAVGFIAAVAAPLAAAGISCNVVAAYHHDHLLVPADRADKALALLKAMATDAAAR
ncbi:ACT domain-containing protein [Sphingoaurantiacus capsulatus]|uniref:ACT domain-containing protein n=1 Tax=Sphingoaurantiacus capsulatus TaxID=1771310 RepID=A0ABV7XF01_9SPHN